MAWRVLQNGAMLEIVQGLRTLSGGGQQEVTSVIIARQGQILKEDLSADLRKRYREDDPVIRPMVEYGEISYEEPEEEGGEPKLVFTAVGIPPEDGGTSGESASESSGDSEPADDSAEVATLKEQVAKLQGDLEMALKSNEELVGELKVASESLDAAAADLDAATAPQPVPYEKLSAEALQVEADKRGLTVAGSGAGGNVLKADNVKALQEADAAE
jgi:hypothetical protein